MRGRPRRGVALGLVGLAATLTACGGGDAAPDPLAGYVGRVNAVQQQAAPQFQRANDAYKQVAKGELGGRKAALALRRAELDIADARRRLGRLPAPPGAERLRRLLLRTYELNVLMAADTRQMAIYTAQSDKLLAPLGGLRKRLRRRLADAAGPDGQIRALRSYAGSVRRIRLRLERLNPPAILASTRESQLTLLRRAGPLASRLADAIDRRDPEATRQLTVRFRASGVSPKQTRGLLRGSIVAYRQRLTLIQQSGAQAQTELSRLLRRRAT